MTKLLLLAISINTYTAHGQLFMTRTGFIGFYSKTPLENISAENKQVSAVIDAGKKNIAFSLLVKSFVFPNKLMQEHFNENYVESDKFPKASFVGAYVGYVNTVKNGLYAVTAKGRLTLHGITRLIEVPATIEVRNDALIGYASFKLKPAEFNIKVPSIVSVKIAELIDVRVAVECTPTQNNANESLLHPSLFLFLFTTASSGFYLISDD